MITDLTKFNELTPTATKVNTVKRTRKMIVPEETSSSPNETKNRLGWLKALKALEK